MQGPGLTGGAGMLTSAPASRIAAQAYESMAGGTSVALSNFTGNTRINPRNYQEVLLNYMQYGLNRYINTIIPMAHASIDRIKSQLRMVIPEFWLANKLLEQDDRHRLIVQQAWMDMGMAYVDEWMTMGVAAYRLNETATGDPVPQIVNSSYIFVTRYVNLKDDKPGFRVWRTIKRSTGEQLVTPKVDSKVNVIYGYDADPDDTGRLTTPLAPLIKEEAFLKLIRDCAAQAEVIRAKPEKVIELPDTGTKAADGLMHGYYVDGDTAQKRAEDRFDRSTTDIMLGIIQNDRVRRWWDNQQAKEIELNKMGKGKRFPTTQQSQLTPLIPGAKLASQTLPSPRPDLLGLMEDYNKTITTLYGIPLGVLSGESNKTAAGATTNVNMFNETIRTWCIRLGRVFTEMYQRIYGVSDTIFQMENNEKTGETRLRVTEIVLPHNPAMTQEELLVNYCMGFISYDEARMSIRHRMGFHTPSGGRRNKDNEDPWDLETKLSVLRNAQSGAMSLTGLAGSFIFNSMPVNTMVQGTQMLVDQSVNPPKTPDAVGKIGAGSKRKAPA